MAVAIIIIPIRWCAAATASSRSTSTCRAARRRRRRCSTASSCCRRRSSAPAILSADPGDMDDKLEQLAEYVAAALPGVVGATEIRHGELCCQVERDGLIRALAFLRDDPKCR